MEWLYSLINQDKIGENKLSAMTQKWRGTMGNKNIRKIIVFIMLFAMLASTLLAGLTFLL